MIRFPPFFVFLCFIAQQPSFSFSSSLPFPPGKSKRIRGWRAAAAAAAPTSHLPGNGLVAGVTDPPTQINQDEESIIINDKKQQQEAIIQQTNKNQQERKTIFFIALLGLSGCVEAICFRRFGAFPNMMTGNTVRCLDALVDQRFGDIRFYVGMITSYVSGGALFKGLDKARAFPKTPNLVWLARLSFALFAISDLVGNFVRDRLRLIPLAMAFGMINAATQEATGAVTNAVTGHYTKIGVGIGETIAQQLQSSSQTLQDTTTTTSKGDDKTKSIIINPVFKKSVQGLSAFVLGLFLTHSAFQWLESTRPWIISRLPPLGFCLGMLYTALLNWYNRAITEYSSGLAQ